MLYSKYVDSLVKCGLKKTKACNQFSKPLRPAVYFHLDDIVQSMKHMDFKIHVAVFWLRTISEWACAL